MSITEKQLGQARPANSLAVSIYSPGASVRGLVKTIFVANTTSGAVSFRIFVDDDGTTYDETTALFWDTTIDGSTTVELNSYIAMDNSSGNLAVRTDSPNALTFTVFGAEIGT